MKMYLGSDHGGFELKEQLKAWLSAQGHTIEDCGAYAATPDDDFPQFAFAVAEKVAAEPEARGLLLCRSAGGMVIAANKVPGIRAVAALNEAQVKQDREHDDINILSISGNWTTSEQAQHLIQLFLDTPYSQEERHQRRLNAITAYEQAQV
ncbi:MAG TPA: RpiB/LacA/LacB family sugar-phosphate isomerase [Vitreimonas sp.]|nr:RpiB/LacA/LacB family sugar-phosphate isomerase [Vitreimonas sp.]